MEGYRILEIKKSVFENNDREADLLGRKVEAEVIDGNAIAE